MEYRFIVKPLSPEDGGGWLAEIPDLPGCIGDGETVEEAIRDLEEAKSAWIEAQISAGKEVPKPEVEPEYSGRITLRIPKSLHRRLAYKADSEGVSLNQYILSLVAENHGKTTSSQTIISHIEISQKVTDDYPLLPERFNFLKNREGLGLSQPRVQIDALSYRPVDLGGKSYVNR